MHRFCFAPTTLVFVTSAVPFTFSIRHFSECCCGPQETHNYVLRHPCSDPWVARFCRTSLLIFTFSNCAISPRPLLSSKSFKNDSNYKHYWSCWFLSWSVDIVFSPKTSVIISILGVVDFCCVHLIFNIFIFPKEILIFWYVRRFVDFVNIAYLLYFQWKTTHFGTFTDSSFSTIIHFCYTSLLIFNILMLVNENLNRRLGVWYRSMRFPLPGIRSVQSVSRAWRVVRDVSCVRRRARQINWARGSGEEDRHSVGKEILLKFLLLFCSGIRRYLAKCYWRVSGNYVSLLKYF